MIAFPNAKINLGLKVVDRRHDGFHNIETIFFPLGLCDILEIIVAGDGIFSFHSSGLSIPGTPDDNLCVKAYRILAEKIKIPPVKIHLHKVIPFGSGTGGGSSDGAFTIKLLNDLLSMGLSEEIMIRYATRLGSDCVFFIRNHAAFAQGKGEQLVPVNIDLSSFKIAIVVPNIHIDTRKAYEWLDSHAFGNKHQFQHHPFFTNKLSEVYSWKDELTNDFELAVFSRHPEIRKIKELLYSKGAVYSSMTGSGAAVYGLFKEDLQDLSGFENCFVWIG